MSIREEARQEAERLWPVEVKTTVAWASRRIGFELGAVWRDEQADRVPSERLMVLPAIQAVRDVLDGLEDWEIQDHALGEIRSALDDIPDCVSATAIPHEEHGETSDDEVEAAARRIYETDAPSHEPDEWFTESEALRSDYRATARAALLAAQGVRRG